MIDSWLRCDRQNNCNNVLRTSYMISTLNIFHNRLRQPQCIWSFRQCSKACKESTTIIQVKQKCSENCCARHQTILQMHWNWLGVSLVLSTTTTVYDTLTSRIHAVHMQLHDSYSIQYSTWSVKEMCIIHCLNLDIRVCSSTDVHSNFTWSRYTVLPLCLTPRQRLCNYEDDIPHCVQVQHT